MADPDFAPFDPTDQDAPLPPAERIKRAFEATRVADRTTPGYPGAFLYAGELFDPKQRRFLGVPLDDSSTPSVWRKGPSFSQAMADKLGSADLDRERLRIDRGLAYAKRILGH